MAFLKGNKAAKGGKRPDSKLEAVQQVVQLKKEAQTVFLLAFMEKGTVYHAARKANVGRQTVYDWIRSDDAFRKALDDTKADYQELLEAEADRRAVHGTDHPVMYKGEITDTYKEYSDTLLMFRLKRLDPSYRDRVDMNHSSKMEHTVDRETIRALMLTKEGREAAEAVTKALMAQMNGNGTGSHI